MREKRKPPLPRPGHQPAPEDSRTRPPSSVHEKVRVSFEYYEVGGKYCLSSLTREQAFSYLNAFKKLTERTWQQLLEGSSKTKGEKSGLNCTQYEKSALVNPDIWPRLSLDITRLLGVRADERRRLSGVRVGHVFYVLWFDESHAIIRG